VKPFPSPVPPPDYQAPRPGERWQEIAFYNRPDLGFGMGIILQATNTEIHVVMELPYQRRAVPRAEFFDNWRKQPPRT
jgi:hypothetical protein